jgi:putative FmdB family regulatory protein
MPTYEYQCKSCGHTFETFQSMSDAPLKTCPECGKEIRRLINGGTGVIFKGSGFYNTDKKARAEAKKAAKEKTAGGKAADTPCASCPASKEAGGSCPASGEKAAS